MIELGRVILRVDCMEPDTFVPLPDLLMLGTFFGFCGIEKDCESSRSLYSVFIP